MIINSVAEAIQAFDSQLEIGRLYDRPISQQAVNQWLREGRIPPGRVPRLVRALQERGYQVKAGSLHPSFQ